MSGLHTKKSGESRQSAARSATKSVSSAPRFRIMVEQAAELGGGYFIVKMVGMPETAAAKRGIGRIPQELVRKDIPQITTRKLHSVLEKYRKENSGEVRLSGTERASRGSDEFMAKHAADAMANRVRQLRSGALLNSTDYCHRRGISRQALSKAVKDQRVFYLDGPSGTQLYPAFFASESASRRDMERVSKELGDLPGESKWQFFTTPKISLGGKSPIEALERGELERVLMAAAGFRER